MASSRRTGTNENVSTYGGAGEGRDYTSLATWESATDTNLVSATQSEVLECYDDAANFDDRVTLAGATTSALYFRIIRPAGTKGQASWQGHDGTPSVGVTFTTSSGIGFLVSGEDYVSVQDLIFDSVDNDTCETDSGDYNSWVGLILVDCLGRGINISGGTDNVVVNCIVIRQDEHPFLADTDDCYFYNCTAIDSVAGRGFNEFSVDPTWINCLGDGNFDDDFDGGSGFLEENNASGDATASGTGSRINQTFTFVNAGADDYNLASNDAGARNYGQDLSSDSIFPFDDDIRWQTRPGESVWDIGASEYVPDSGPANIDDINGTDSADINDINGVLYSGIVDVNGVD